MLLVFLLLFPAFALIWWAIPQVIKSARTSQTFGIKYIAALVSGLCIIASIICLLILILASFSHSAESQITVQISCAFTFFFIVIVPASWVIAVHRRTRMIQSGVDSGQAQKSGWRFAVAMIAISMSGIFVFWGWKIAYPLLMYVARNHWTKAAYFMIDHRISINSVDNFGWSPIAFFAAQSDIVAVSNLLERGSSPNISGNKGSALIHAIIQQNLELVSLLLNNGADPDQSANEITPLMHAAGLGSSAIMQSLLSAGAGVDKRTSQGTALLWAVKNKRIDAAHLLLSQRANPDLKSASGITPLMAAVEIECPELVQSLLHYKADAHLKDTMGNTALNIAVKRQNEDIIDVFRQAGFSTPFQ